MSLVGNAEVTENILKLSERMVMSFCSGVSGSLIHQWAEVTGAATNEVMIRSRKNNGDPGRPAGTVLGASTSIWLPITPKRVFDFLCNLPTRNQVQKAKYFGAISELIKWHGLIFSYLSLHKFDCSCETVGHFAARSHGL